MRIFLSIFSLWGIILLTGCGFEPANGTAVSRSQTGAIVPPITLPQPGTKSEYLLKNELQRLLPSDQGNYRLAWTYSNQITGTDLNSNSDYTRYNNRYILNWRLYDSQNNVVKSSISRTNIGINIAKTGYPTTAAQQDADREAAKLLSQDVYNQLRTYFKQNK
ncbi:MAG: LPS assembly lipoprotein LptE [Alphaproteobacteria bacterium]